MEGEFMKTTILKCPQCGEGVQQPNMENHIKNHGLESKMAQKKN